MAFKLEKNTTWVGLGLGWFWVGLEKNTTRILLKMAKNGI